jgi:hypothetical protein
LNFYCGYGHQHNTEADSESIGEEENAFQEDWSRLNTEEDVNFSSYATVESESAMCRHLQY